MLEKEPSKLDALFLRLSSQYPGDVGCFSIYLLNYMTLAKGEAIFLFANVPHAYLYGDGVECMACSDNVVRAGLTPKFKDVRVLCSMLDYRMRSVDENKLKPSEASSSDPHIVEFRPSVDEFSVQQVRVHTDKDQTGTQTVLSLPKLDTASVLIVIENNFEQSHFQAGQKRLHTRPGLVYFIDADADVTFHGLAHSNSSTLLAYRAFVDIKS